MSKKANPTLIGVFVLGAILIAIGAVLIDRLDLLGAKHAHADIRRKPPHPSPLGEICHLLLGIRGEEHSHMGCWATAMHAVHAIPAVIAAPPDVVVRDKKVGNGKITTIESVEPAPAPFPREKGVAVVSADPKALPTAGDTPPSICLTASDWKCGRCFTDELDRRWCLISGPAYSDKPAQVTGWIVTSDDGRTILVTAGARVYLRVR